jgi:hypothetical protein
LTASDDEQRGQPGESTAEAALYIASLAEELARFARTHGFETLAYLSTLPGSKPIKFPSLPAGQPPGRPGAKIDWV